MKNPQRKLRIFLLSEIKELTGGYIQSVANIKNNVERHGAIGCFDAAHMCAADIHKLRKPRLRKAALLAVVCDIQTEIFIFIKLSRVHYLTLIYFIRCALNIPQRIK